MQLRPSFRNVLQKTAVPFRALGDFYLLVDDIVWHGYARAAEALEKRYPALTRPWVATGCLALFVYPAGFLDLKPLTDFLLAEHSVQFVLCGLPSPTS